MLIETFIRKQLGLKAHTVTKVEETDGYIIHVDWLGVRLLRFGLCRQRCRKMHSVRKPRVWRDLSMRKLHVESNAPRCGVRVGSWCMNKLRMHQARLETEPTLAAFCRSHDKLS
jgi:hypothetical protein